MSPMAAGSHLPSIGLRPDQIEPSRWAIRPAGVERPLFLLGALPFKFTGRLGDRALTPGVYHLTGVATDAAGNHGRAQFVRFTIVR